MDENVQGRSMKHALFLLFAIASTTVSAKPDCQKEKDEADHWNDQLKQRVTEYHRDKHREAKDAYLACIRNPVKPSSTVPSTSNVENKAVKPVQAPRYKTPKPRPRNTRPNRPAVIKVNEPKQVAWQEFYRPSAECINNKGDMTLFVECSKEERRYKAEFERRWDPVKQQLTPLLN
jgi:hypothetical protein